MRYFRLALELLGLAGYLAAHLPLAIVYVLGSSLPDVQPVLYWTALALGYLVMVGLAIARPGRLRSLPARSTFDAWLVTALPALVLVTVFAASHWPLEYAGWSGHGFGAEGGEVNATLFPWLHAALWVASVGVIATRREAGPAPTR
jgi:hypothetical protein